MEGMVVLVLLGRIGGSLWEGREEEKKLNRQVRRV
jgi:hypothetical protein